MEGLLTKIVRSESLTMITTFTLAAAVMGALLGLRFKVLILIPAIAVSSAAVVYAGLSHGSSTGSILLLIVMTMTAIQFGYFAGAILGNSLVSSRKEKDSSGIVEVVQRLLRYSA